MVHCLRHTSLDNKHGRSVKAIHSFLSRWRAGTESDKKASAQQAARRTGVLGRSMSASAWRTLWTVAKPKTPRGRGPLA